MNRKTALKSIAAIVALSGTSGILYKFLSPDEAIPLAELPKKKALIAELAETIIPRTDTPGAKDAQVENYIIKMITENSGVKTQRSFLAGLYYVESYTLEEFNKPFSNCTPEQKNSIVKRLENKARYSFKILNKVNKKLFGSPFFFLLRDLTVEGYCTSFVGATKGMAYDYTPVTFDACIPLQKNQLAWATK
jgi:hypothetical protein